MPGGCGGVLHLLKSPLVGEVAHQLEEELIVWGLVNAHQQQAEDEKQHQLEPELSRQGGQKDQEHHQDAEKAHQYVPQGHPSEKFRGYLGLFWNDTHGVTSIQGMGKAGRHSLFRLGGVAEPEPEPELPGGVDGGEEGRA